MRAEILKYDVNAPREQGFSNQRMYPDNRAPHGFSSWWWLQRKAGDGCKDKINCRRSSAV